MIFYLDFRFSPPTKNTFNYRDDTTSSVYEIGIGIDEDEFTFILRTSTGILLFISLHFYRYTNASESLLLSRFSIFF